VAHALWSGLRSGGAGVDPTVLRGRPVWRNSASRAGFGDTRPISGRVVGTTALCRAGLLAPAARGEACLLREYPEWKPSSMAIARYPGLAKEIAA
jgi:hypothetical protein